MTGIRRAKSEVGNAVVRCGLKSGLTPPGFQPQSHISVFVSQQHWTKKKKTRSAFSPKEKLHYGSTYKKEGYVGKLMATEHQSKHDLHYSHFHLRFSPSN
jgi:hypothetical protein